MWNSIGLGVAVILLSAATRANAGQITNLQLYDGPNAPAATITYTNPDGTGSNSDYCPADPQVSYGTTTPVFYCVDLWHDNYVGDSYTITPVASMAFPSSTFADVDNRIGWLLDQDQSTAADRAAVQLAIWYTTDSVGFSMTSSDSAVTADYNALISFAGYDSDDFYAANFWQATHDSTNTLYQNLVSAPSGEGVNNLAVPEPGSLWLALMALVVVAAVDFCRARARAWPRLGR